MDLTPLIKRVQLAIGEKADGIAGINTWTTLARKLKVIGGTEPVSILGAAIAESDKLDTRSEGNIATLHAKLRPLARLLIQLAKAEGINARITSGTRSYAEQDALYDQGNVTKARGGYSNHNFGVAFDVTIFSPTGLPIWESPQYKRLGQIGKNVGLSWGGDWVSFQDEPHFELRPVWAAHMTEGAMLAEFRSRVAHGDDVLAAV